MASTSNHGSSATMTAVVMATAMLAAWKTSRTSIPLLAADRHVAPVATRMLLMARLFTTM
jgi:hypothetical protein